MKLLKKIWNELIRVRKIQFISYETSYERLERLKKRKEAIKRLTQYVIDDTYHQDNILIPYSYAREQAIRMLNKKVGA